MAIHRLLTPVPYPVPCANVTEMATSKPLVPATALRKVGPLTSAMVMLYRDIGGLILERQEREEWGAKVIDRLSADLREAFPDMRGLSPRNLKYMRAFVKGRCLRSILAVPTTRWRQ